MEKSRGFTLIEVLIAVSLISVILAGGFSLYWTGVKAWNMGENQIEVQQNVRIALDTVVRDIRRSYKTSVARSGNNISIILYMENDTLVKYSYNSSTKQLGKGEYNNPVANFITEFDITTEGGKIITGDIMTGNIVAVIVKGEYNGFSHKERTMISPRGVE